MVAVVVVVVVVVRLHIFHIRPERRGLPPVVPLASWVPSVQMRSVLVLALLLVEPGLEERVR